MQKGSTLLEVVLAMSIFSMAILPLARLQWISYQQLQEALARTQATLLAEDLIAKKRVDERVDIPSEIKKSIFRGNSDIQGKQSPYQLVLQWQNRYTRQPSSLEVVFVK